MNGNTAPSPGSVIRYAYFWAANPRQVARKAETIALPWC
jgi:hypothetical protein